MVTRLAGHPYLLNILDTMTGSWRVFAGSVVVQNACTAGRLSSYCLQCFFFFILPYYSVVSLKNKTNTSMKTF